MNGSTENPEPLDIGQLKKARDIDGLIRALDYPDWKVRDKSAEALDALGDPHAVDYYLSEATKELKKDLSVCRSGAIDKLEKIHDPRAADLLIAALSDENSFVRMKATQVLGKSRDIRAIKPLILRLKNDDENSVRCAAIASLGEIGDPSAIEALGEGLKDPDKTIRIWTTEALKKIQDPRVIVHMISAISDKDETVRLGASACLAEHASVGDPSAIGGLGEVLKDPDETIRIYAVGALGKIHDPLVIVHMLSVISDKNETVRLLASHYLAEYGSSADLDLFIAMLKERPDNPDPLSREFAACKLRSIGDPRGVEPLINALKDSAAIVRVAAALSLGQMGDDRAVQPLADALKDEDEEVRIAAGWASKRIRPESGREDDADRFRHFQ